MKKFDLYLSGLQYAAVTFEDNRILLEELNVHTGKMQPPVTLTDEENTRIFTAYFIDLKKVHALLSQIKEPVTDDTFASGFQGGEQFACWNDSNPYGQEIWVQRHVKYPMDLTVCQGEIAAVTVTLNRVCVLVKKGFEDCTVLKQWRVYQKNKPLYCISESQNVSIPMRDGIQLSADLLLPAEIRKPVPAILVRTPYGKEMYQTAYHGFVRRGYAVLIQDVRGRNASEGEWTPMYHEKEDGDDTLNWIAGQPWCTGDIGMYGGSYLGYVQWAAASTGNPHLKTLVSLVTSGSPFGDLPRKGGTMSSGALAWSFAVSQKTFDASKMVRDDWEQVMKIRPLTALCDEVLGYKVPFIEKWVTSMNEDSFWEKMDWMRDRDKIKASALIISGWYDDNEIGTTEAIDVTSDYPAGSRKILLGPWLHNSNSSRDIGDISLGNNALRYDFDLLVHQWLDCRLYGIRNGIDEGPAVEYYTVGSNQWKAAESWPVPETSEKTLYFGSHGSLCEVLQQETGNDVYMYDPSKETPYLVNVSENEFGVPSNYRDVDTRSDVLVYETAPFTEDTVITGDMTVNFFAGSDAPDTDWIIKTEHVDSEGNAFKMTDGLLCARFREGFDRPQFMKNGEIYHFKIRTGKISELLQEGHRLRLTITSSAKGLCFPNSNTKEGFNGISFRTARNTIYYGGEYPSHVKLRVE